MGNWKAQCTCFTEFKVWGESDYLHNDSAAREVCVYALDRKGIRIRSGGGPHLWLRFGNTCTLKSHCSFVHKQQHLVCLTVCSETECFRVWYYGVLCHGGCLYFCATWCLRNVVDHLSEYAVLQNRRQSKPAAFTLIWGWVSFDSTSGQQRTSIYAFRIVLYFMIKINVQRLYWTDMLTLCVFWFILTGKWEIRTVFCRQVRSQWLRCLRRGSAATH